MVWWAIPIVFIAVVVLYVGWIHVVLNIADEVESRIWGKRDGPKFVVLCGIVVLAFLPIVILVSWVGS